MIKALELICDWTGGETRRDKASVVVTYISDIGGLDDKVFFQVRPGGGDWPEVETIKSFTVNNSKFEIQWERTGGQNHTIWIKLHPGTETELINIDSSGPITVSSAVKDVPFED